MSKWVLVVCLVGVFLWASYGTIEDLSQLATGLPNVVDYTSRMFPPDSTVLRELVEPTIETVQMVVVSIVLSTLVTVPVSFLAAGNTAPHTGVYVGTRLIVNVLRGLPTFLWAMLFVTMVGLGPLAGILALTLHAIGTMSKLFSEAIESFEDDYLEAMRIDGASELQIMYHGILPGVATSLASYILYRFEADIRAATVLGLVGAGGLGLELTMSVRMFKRHETFTIILLILALVTLVDTASRLIRIRVLKMT